MSVVFSSFSSAHQFSRREQWVLSAPEAKPPESVASASQPKPNPTPSPKLNSRPVEITSAPAAERLLDDLDLSLDARTRLLIAMVEHMTGEELKLPDNSAFSKRSLSLEQTSITAQSIVDSVQFNGVSVAQGEVIEISATLPISTLTFNRQLHLQESEQLSFNMAAEVTLSSGLSYDFELTEHYSRQLDVRLDIRSDVQLTDPLVLNLYGPLQITDEQVSFDLDADGNAETFSQLSYGSGYLALDKNGDGVINDGSELFGAISGQGFSDLAAFDDDGNGLIDSGDQVFAQLQLFRPGDERRQSLGEAGVLAIGLENLNTAFRFTNALGDTQAQIRSSGFYLRQDASGQVHSGSVQQIDLAV